MKVYIRISTDVVLLLFAQNCCRPRLMVKSDVSFCFFVFLGGVGLNVDCDTSIFQNILLVYFAYFCSHKGLCSSQL